MTDPLASSVDRLMWEKGTSLVNGVHGYRGGFLALLINSFVQGMLGVVFTILGLTIPGDTSAPFLIIGPIMMAAGAGLGIGAYLIGKRYAKLQRPQAKLSADGTRLVIRILSHIGWVNINSYRFGGMGQPWNWSFSGRRTSEQVLSSSAFSLLDRCAHEVLRIVGILNSGTPVRDPTLESMKPAIMAAVDDAMVGVLNQVGTMERIPEGGTAIRSQAEADIASLKELADRVESMQAAAPKIVDHLAAPSPIQNVLDQLRQDEAARDELEPDSEVRRTLG